MSTTGTATVLYKSKSSATHSTYKLNDTHTISVLVNHPRPRRSNQQGPSPCSVIMPSDQEITGADGLKPNPSSATASCDSSHPCTSSPFGCMDHENRATTGAPTTSSSATTTEDDEEVEPFRAFLIQSPMMSLRRVGLDLNNNAKPPSQLRQGKRSSRGGLDRTTSAPIPNTVTGHPKLDGKNNRRRSIFDPFWESSSLKQNERFHMPRRHSLDVLEASFPHHKPRAALPGKFVSLSLRTKPEYASTAALDFSFLPSVPAPLERLLSRSSGVYPLFEPKSILKTKARPKDGRSGEPSSTVLQLNQTLTKLSSTSNGSNSTVEDNATDTTCASSSTTFKAVHFDPRVVVTEVHDPVPRCWYSEQELQKFQSDTVNLAKAYLQMHPELIPHYSKPFYDPIVKKMRRKPLFAMQGLSELDVCQNDLPVKRILVVDPNDKFKCLLCRSLQIIFPAAEMVGTHNGLEALDMLKRGDFDIVICQELLSPRKSSSCSSGVGGELETSLALFSKYQQEEKEKWQRTLLISISPFIGEEVKDRSFVGNGATDFVWGLPPPKMDLGLQRSLVLALDNKKAQ